MKPNILVVDDELLLRDVLYDYLIRQDYQVFAASNGEKALDIIKKEDIHLALVDIKMPGMNGLEVTVQIRKVKPKVCVIIMTGYPSLNSAISAIKSGASEYIVKPFRFDELDRIIKKNLESMDTEHENLKLKKKIKELESQLTEKKNNEISGNDQTSGEEKKLPHSNQYTRPMEVPQTKHISNASKLYKSQTDLEDRKNYQEKIDKLNQLFLNGDITEIELKKKIDELDRLDRNKYV